MKHFLIVAGDVDQAKYCMRLFGMSTDVCTFVSGIDRLQGQRGETALMFGTYKDRMDWPRLWESIKAYEIHTIYVQD